MTFHAIHQALPTLAPADAIGNQVLHLQALFRSLGFASEIFVERWHPDYAGRCHRYTQYADFAHPEDLLLLHYSIGGEINAWARDLAQQQTQLALIYHNITPAHFFFGINDDLAQLLEAGRRDLATWAGRCPAIADSPYNQQELEAMGFEVIGVVPPVMDLALLDAELNTAGAARVENEFGKRGTPGTSAGANARTIDWLFVGRQVPNKCLHDIIKAFYCYHTFIQPASRLIFVGSGTGMEPYVDSLYELVTQLNLDGDVVFAGYQPDGLAAFYRMADLYVSMSEHEGFCVPMVEAMHFGVPILAYDSTNIPFVLAGTGVLVKHKDFRLIAELAHEITSNAALKQRLVERQRERLADFTPEAVKAAMLQVLYILETRRPK